MDSGFRISGVGFRDAEVKALGVEVSPWLRNPFNYQSIFQLLPLPYPHEFAGIDVGICPGFCNFRGISEFSALQQPFDVPKTKAPSPCRRFCFRPGSKLHVPC